MRALASRRGHKGPMTAEQRILQGLIAIPSATLATCYIFSSPTRDRARRITWVKLRTPCRGSRPRSETSVRSLPSTRRRSESSAEQDWKRWSEASSPSEQRRQTSVSVSLVLNRSQFMLLCPDMMRTAYEYSVLLYRSNSEDRVREIVGQKL